MKKTISIYLLALVCFSCTSDYEKSMEKTMDCIEDKYDDDVVPYATIDEALTAFDFESARNLVACYEDAPFYTNGDRAPVTMSNANEYNKHWQMMNKVVKAEVTYYLKNGEAELARASAQESNMLKVYNEALPVHINRLIDNGNQRAAISILSKFTFLCSVDDSDDWGWENLNKEVNMFNDMVNSIFNDALLNEDIGTIKKALLLFTPNVDYAENGNDAAFFPKAYEAAMSKLKLAGMSI